MFRLNDLILLIVIYSSLLAGILFPEVCSFFRPLPLYSMMFLLFLSFLSIRVTDIWVIARKLAITIVIFSRVENAPFARLLFLFLPPDLA